MIRRLPLLALVTLIALATSCSASRVPVAQPAPASTPAHEVEITLEHLASADAWRATYRFAEPVRAAHFRRPGYGLRSLYWHVTQPAGVTIEHTLDGGDVGLASSDGKPFREVVIDVPKYDRDSSDYTLFNAFTDGSMLVFTGHFDVIPLVCKHPAGCAAKDLEDAAPKEKNHFVLVPRSNEHLVLQGGVQAAKTEWDSDGEGVWAYFGSIAPVRAPQLVAVLDPGLPVWLREKLGELLPDIFTYYASRTGQSLHPLPTVYLSFNPLPGESGIGIGGGTRIGNVQLLVDLGKKYVHEASPRAVERIAYLFAHEGAHLWNNQMFPQDGEKNDWMHEGGADAFASRAMLHFGVITRERYEEELSEAVSTCMLALSAGKAIRDMGESGHYEGYYSCGATLGLWTEAAIARAHPELDLFDFWARLFAMSRDHHYDDALYYRTLSSLAGADASDALRSLVEQPHPDAAAFLTRELGKVGVVVVPDTPAKLPYRYDELAGRWAFDALVSHDCGSANGRVAADDGSFEVLDATGCKHLGKGLVVAKMGGFDVKTNGAQAFDYVVTQCRDGKDVALDGGAAKVNAVSVPCTATLGARGTYVRVTSAPRVR